MKSRVLSFVPALLILAAGAFLLQSQRREITSLQESKIVRAVRPPGEAAPAPSATAQKSAAAPNASPAGAVPPEAKAAAFIEKLRQQARPLIDKTDREAFARSARFRANRTSLLLKLNPAETESLRGVLEKRTGASLAASTREWVVQNRGEETALKLDAAEAASRTATVEHDAQDAIFRLSRIVDLTPEQKDRLYASFVRKASASPVPDYVPSELVFSFSLKDTPSITNPGELANSLLTPEQLALYEASRAQENKAAADATGEVMGQLVPTMLSALESASRE
jgi:hypothetical protein